MIISQSAQTLLNELNQKGFEAFVVGGCVRDMLMGTPPHDYDITTSATPDEVKRIFQNYRVIETGLKHGTVTVLLDGEPFEITTYRIESSYTDSRHPDGVRFTRSLTEDLARRDFTVNAIAYNPRVGIVDPFDGRSDIENKILRCVGVPYERFSEDALRILRLLRFASSLGFQIEASTAEAAFRLKEKLLYISAERTQIELCKILCGQGAGKIITEYIDILSVVIPELLPLKQFDQHNPHHIYDILTHTAVTVDSITAEKTLRLAALFHEIGKPSVFSLDENGFGHFYSHASVGYQMTEDILSRLKFDNLTKNNVVRLVKWHDTPIEANEKSVKRALGKMTPDFFFMLLALKRADNLAQNPTYSHRQEYYNSLESIAKDILARQVCFSLKDLAIDGNDLMAIGIRPGRSMGLILKQLLDDVIQEKIPNEKDSLLKQAQKLEKDN